MLSFLLSLHYLNIRTLQVPHISQYQTNKFKTTAEKRVPPFIPTDSVGRIPASLTMEAALSLPLFLFFAISLLQPMNWLDRQRKVQTALEAVCEEMSLTAYLTELYGIDKSGQESEPEDSGTGAGGIFSDAAAGLFLKGKTGEYADGIIITKSELSDEDGNIRMEVQYREKPGGIEIHAAGRRRPWIGLNGKLRGAGNTAENGENDEEMVYVGANMGRYHLYRDCHYLSNQYETLPAGQAGNARNASGKRYTACSRCVKEGTRLEQVYVTPEGEHYHADKSCSAMASYVRRVPKKEVEYLGLCSYCAGRGG